MGLISGNLPAIIVVGLSITAVMADVYEDACAYQSSGRIEYGQWCYSVSSITAHFDAAEAACAANHGYLAVTISDKLRELLSPLLLQGAAYIGLKQFDISGGPAEDWKWTAEGMPSEIEAGQTSNLITWSESGPTDTNHSKQVAVLNQEGFVADNVAEEERQFICQYRKRVASLGLYAKQKLLVIPGKNAGPTSVNVPTAENCAILCYQHPACMAITYYKTGGYCKMFYERPQDYPHADTTENQDAEIWVKG